MGGEEHVRLGLLGHVLVAGGLLAIVERQGAAAAFRRRRRPCGILIIRMSAASHFQEAALM